MSTTTNFKRGATILETLIYVFIFTLVSLSVVTIIFSLNRSYSKIRSAVALESGVYGVLDRITREAKGATSIDTANSTLGTSPGVLTLNTTDDSGASNTIQFLLSSGTVRVKENGVDIGPLTSNNVRVTSLIFTKINTPVSTAVRTSLTLESGSAESYKSRTLYVTSVLRSSYIP